jgi:hypothetical protein
MTHCIWPIILSRVGVTIDGVWIGNRSTERLKLVTTGNYISIANSHALNSSLQHTLSLLSLPCLHRLPGNGFQRRSSLSFHVPRLLSSLAIAYLRTELGVAWLVSIQGLFLTSLRLTNRCLNTPDSHEYTLQITVTHRLVFPVTVFPALRPPAHGGSSVADFSTLKMEVIYSSETSVHTWSTRRHIT